MGNYFLLQSATGKSPAPPRPPRAGSASRHERMSAVEARKLFPLGGSNAGKRGRFPVVKKEFRTLDGIPFDSKLEMNFYAELRQRELAGEVSNIEYHPSWDVEIGGAHYCTFTADFRFYEHYRGKRVVEVKSSGTQKDAAYRLRRKAAQLAHNLEIIEVVR